MKYLYLLSIIVLGTLSSCQEKGCNDPDAVNFEDSINKDDGSCLFEGKVVFINSESTQKIVDEGGSVLVNIQGTTYPSYDHSEMMNVMNCAGGYISISMGSIKELSLDYSVSITDVDGISSLSGGELTTTATSCSIIEL